MADPSTPLVTRRTFIRRFPEFRDVDAEFIQNCIDEAHYRIDETVWGDDRAPIGIMWKAAELASISPLGETARVGKDADQSRYGMEFRRMMLEVTSGFRVI